MTTRVKVPRSKSTAAAARTVEDTTLQPLHVRVPQESEPILKSVLVLLFIFIAIAVISLPFAFSRKEVVSLVGWCIFGVLAAWMVLPFIGLLVRMSGIVSGWKALTKDASNAIVPDTRQSPQAIMNDICRSVPLSAIPTVLLVPGDIAGIMSLPGQVIITEELYRKTTDREMQWLFVHEVGHFFAGHIGTLPLAAAVPSEDEHLTRMLMLPLLPLCLALEEWALWADVTADRLAMVVIPDYNRAVLGVLRHVLLTLNEETFAARITRFVDAEGQVAPGDHVGVNQAITDLRYNRHDADQRLTSLSEWKEQDAYRNVLQIMQERMGTLPTAPAVTVPAAPASPAIAPELFARQDEASEDQPNTLNLTPLEPESAPSVPLVRAAAPAASPLPPAPVANPMASEGAPDMPLKRLAELGLTLPPPPQPLGIYVPFTRAGNLLYLCGQLPLIDGKLPSEFTGKVGASVPLERAQQAARQAALNSLAIIHGAVGLGKVKQIVRVSGYVSSASGFTQQPVVLNGASELLAQVLGDAGRHARIAIGVAVLPMDACIEIDMIVEVE